ncbi:hypothetical protein [Humisphaera borealis]|uniref:Uncharacterized protein n=1 Tax=Humisphaera borealis TaxID=2807512 RepID=A0A7M2WTM6_9BACT|nr:hypothetical protein [Humisphaera borealis]QOV88868.1 hypothetical protein IPV69_21980 [Humisphaera borealis]
MVDLSRAIETPIAVDPPVVKAFEGRVISVNLRDVTLDDVLCAISPAFADREHRLVLVRNREGLTLRRASDASQVTSVRVHDIGELLPADQSIDPPSLSPLPATAPAGGLFASSAARQVFSTNRDERADCADGVSMATEFYIFQTTGNDPNRIVAPPRHTLPVVVWRFERLIVLAPQIDQPRAAAFLAALKERRR